jgi:hypothetical protein
MFIFMRKYLKIIFHMYRLELKYKKPIFFHFKKKITSMLCQIIQHDYTVDFVQILFWKNRILER